MSASIDNRSAHPQPDSPQSGYPQSGYPQSGYPQSGQGGRVKRLSAKNPLGQLKWLSRQIAKDINRGIFAQTLLVVLGVALVPTLGLLIANHRSASLQSQRLEQVFEEAATATGLDVEHWIEVNRLALQQNAALGDVASMDRDRQVQAMKTLVDTYDWAYIAFTLGLDGYMNARNDIDAKPVEKWDGSKAHFRGDRQYFQQITDGADLGNELLISRTSGMPALCLSVPIKQKFQLAGALVSCSHLDAIARAISDTQIGDSGIAILVDGENRIIAHGGAIRVSEELEDFSQYPALVQGQMETPIEFKWRARRVTAYVKAVGADTGLKGWKLIIQQDTSEANQPVTKARWNAFFLLSSTGLLTLGIAYAFSRQLVRPIKALTTAANEVSMGQLDVEVEGIERQDEIGGLARSVKRLATSVAIAFEEMDEEEVDENSANGTTETELNNPSFSEDKHQRGRAQHV